MTRQECIAAGYELDLCKFYENGNLGFRLEWNADKTETDIVESYYEDGNLKSRFEWNGDKTTTYVVERYYRNGNIESRWEWNEDRTSTIRKQP